MAMPSAWHRSPKIISGHLYKMIFQDLTPIVLNPVFANKERNCNDISRLSQEPKEM